MASGTLTEAKVLTALAERDLSVFLPFDADEPYDLLVDLRDGRFVRVQCKTGRERGGCIVFNACSTDHGRGRRSYQGRADVFGVWCQGRDEVYVVPVADVPRFLGSLRLVPARNNQAKGVRWAADHTLGAWVASLGLPGPTGTATPTPGVDVPLGPAAAPSGPRAG